MPQSLSPTHITFTDVLKRLARPCHDSGADASSHTVRETKPFPEMRGGMAHRLYAMHIVAGVPHKVACQELDIKPRTADDWRSDLIRSVSEYLGRDVDYHFAARFMVEAEIRQFCTRPQTPV